MRRLLSVLRFALPLWVVAVCAAQTPCERLKSLSLPNTTITAAESVAAGLFRAPDQPQNCSRPGAGGGRTEPAGDRVHP